MGATPWSLSPGGGTTVSHQGILLGDIIIPRGRKKKGGQRQDSSSGRLQWGIVVNVGGRRGLYWQKVIMYRAFFFPLICWFFWYFSWNNCSDFQGCVKMADKNGDDSFDFLMKLILRLFLFNLNEHFTEYKQNIHWSNKCYVNSVGQR